MSDAFPPATASELPVGAIDGRTVVHLRLISAGVDYPVAFDRVPVVGERITGPDHMRAFVVSEVDWRFERGFAFPPVPVVVAHPKAKP